MNYDIGIIGAGVAGAFAAYNLAKKHKDLKVILFDIGRPPLKRRRQLEGWLGVLPNSDGKLYLNDLSKVGSLISDPKKYYSEINSLFKSLGQFSIIKDKSPIASLDKKIKKMGYSFQLNDYVQLIPKEIHMLSKHMSEVIRENITYSFDNEVYHIQKQKNMFSIQTQYHEYKCNKILISVGRSGWRWAYNLYKNFGIIENNQYAKFGVRLEIASSYMKDFNESNCLLTKEKLEVGPFSWNGTVIPEDHVDLAISAFRSNENRWKTEKVSFNLIREILTDNTGTEQTDRIGKLTFVLTNDRILKEKVSNLMSKKSVISVIPEYNWVRNDIEELSGLIPDLIDKANFHVPTILPLVPKINIGNNLETEVGGMFVAGESAGIPGILSAAIMGCAVVDGITK